MTFGDSLPAPRVTMEIIQRGAPAEFDVVSGLRILGCVAHRPVV